LTGFLSLTHIHPSSYCYHHHCILHPFHNHRKHTYSHINSPTMDASQYNFSQQSGNQVMGDQPLSATSGGHVSQHFNSGPIFYGYLPAAPYQGQNYGPQGPYVPAFYMPTPVQQSAYAVPPAAPFAYQASNAIGMQVQQQFPVQASAAHPGSTCQFSALFEGQHQQAYRALCNDVHQRHGRSCAFVGEDTTRKAIADYTSGEASKAWGDFRRRAQKTVSQRGQRAKKAAAKQKLSPQNAVQQPADQVQPQAPHQGNALTVDPTVDPDLLYKMRIGPYPGDFDFQQ
jgi:hypothetical protein